MTTGCGVAAWLGRADRAERRNVPIQPANPQAKQQKQCLAGAIEACKLVFTTFSTRDTHNKGFPPYKNAYLFSDIYRVKPPVNPYFPLNLNTSSTTQL